MLLKKWDMLPAFMQTESVREYYDILSHKKDKPCCEAAF